MSSHARLSPARLLLDSTTRDKVERLAAHEKRPVSKVLAELLEVGLAQRAPGDLPEPDRLELPGVTLLLLNGNDPDQGARVLRFLESRFDFERILHLTFARPRTAAPGEYIQIPRFDYRQAMRFQSRCLGRYIETPFVIQIEPDGFPVNPHLWKDEFLEWDYIGAPWPPTLAPPECRVGNGGCSLRSKRFLAALENAPDHLDENGDVYMCQRPDVRKYLDEQGIRFAPIDIAIQFAVENMIPEFPDWTDDQSFGFHGFIGDRVRVLDGF